MKVFMYTFVSTMVAVFFYVVTVAMYEDAHTGRNSFEPAKKAAVPGPQGQDTVLQISGN